MTEQQACTLCGAGGHLAAQCQWAPAIAADIYAKLSSYGALRTSVDNILDVMEAIREVELGHRAYVSADEALVNAEYDLSFARCSNDLPTAKRNVRNAQMSLIALRSLIQCDRPHSPRGASDVAENRFEAPVEGWGDPAPPEPPVECPHRCGSVFAKESYGAGFIEGSGMCPTCDAAMPAKDIVNPGDEPTPPELLAAKLIDTWRAVHGRPVPWEKAVEITAIATSMSSEERERLLAMSDAPAANAAPSLGEFWFEYLHPNGERHTVTVSRDQVLEQMPDFIFEALCDKFCNCQPVGETNVIECCCDEYAEEFQLVTVAPAQGGE
ncbi:hypothetical protein [Pseudomonas nitroreducens]|uniref:hypothetical protein n=1 Tax=Pseudomonas nitroreducens TaxID=46680 RepID=UPI002D80FBDD|nr:hypothetical protein [Pseudomonas nitroreducens]